MLAGFWLPVHIDSLLTKLSQWRKRATSQPQPQPGVSKLVLAGMIAACLVLATVLFNRTREVRIDKTEFPVDAIHFMADNGLRGKLVVTYNWAQYALAALGPDTKVAFDGRFRTCYPQQIVDMHFDLVLGNNLELRWRSPASGPFNECRVLQYERPNLVLIDRSQQPSTATMAAQSDWTLLYQDGIAQVWGRRSRYDIPGSSNYLPAARRRLGTELPTGFARWPALPAGIRPTTSSALHVQGFPRNNVDARLIQDREQS